MISPEALDREAFAEIVYAAMWPDNDPAIPWSAIGNKAVKAPVYQQVDKLFALISAARGAGEEMTGPMTVLVDADWLRRKVEADPDADTEAAAPPPPPVSEEVALGIARELMAALEPFADACEHLHPSLPDDGVTLDGLTVADWRRAYATLSKARQIAGLSGLVRGEDQGASRDLGTSGRRQDEGGGA